MNTDESSHNPQNQKLFDGCQRLGFETQSIPRNAKRCGDCGFCNYGCRSGAKQDTRQTYLADAIQSGARLYAGTEVDRLLIKSGEVAGAYARIQQGTRKKEIEIRCKKIVVAAGSIHSPAILIRSGIDNKNLGEHLHLHPTTAIVGFHEDKIEAWRGAPQTVLCDQFANLDGHDHGVRFEVAPLHPGFAAMALAWRDPAHHKRLMQNMSYLSNVIVLCRDKQAGRVILNGNGSAEIQYQPAKHERIHLIEGAKQALRIQLAAGAWKMLGPHQTPVVFDKHAEHCPQSYRDFDRFIQRVETLGARPNSLSMFSAHQMSTCRMATRSARGVVDPAGQVFGVRNLFVADASVFPSASGVNPMITIMSIADYLSESISA